MSGSRRWSKSSLKDPKKKILHVFQQNMLKYIYLRIIMTRKSGKHLHVTYGTAVSTLLGLISSAHLDLRHWRSNQQPHYAEAKTLSLGHQFMPHISDAELTSHGELCENFDLMCLEGT